MEDIFFGETFLFQTTYFGLNVVAANLAKVAHTILIGWPNGYLGLLWTESIPTYTRERVCAATSSSVPFPLSLSLLSFVFLSFSTRHISPLTGSLRGIAL